MHPAKRKPFAPPKKRKPDRREGKVTHTVRLHGPEKSALRDDCFRRSQGFCEVRLPGCLSYAPWLSGEMAHIRSVGSGGSDTLENVLWSCMQCHSKLHNAGGKPCPPKPESAA